MIRKKTVLILGAGASAPYGFPTAWELRHLLLGDSLSDTRFVGMQANIAKACNRDGPIAEFHKLVTGTSGLFFAGDYRKDFRLSHLASIDAFLARRKDESYVTSAKRAIAAILLACEERRNRCGDWYAQLFSELTQEGEQIENLVVITFNYDRSLEHFLRTSYTATYGKSDADKWANQIPIIHVYGSLGPLDRVGFGEVRQFEESSSFIKLVREKEECEQVDVIYEHLRTAKTIAFLGFGFDELNLHAIGIHRNRERNFPAQFFATMKGLSAPRKSGANALLNISNRSLLRGEGSVRSGLIEWYDGSVADLLHNECVF